MHLTPQTMVVFQRRNLRKAEDYCRVHAGAWTMICAFDTAVAESERVAGIDYVELFAHTPYQPRLVTGRVRQLIDSLFANTLLDGRSLDTALTVEGAPLLRAKDNEVMEYVLHRLIFVMDALLDLLASAGQRRVWILTDRSDRFTLPEWPSFERLLDLDAVYGPVFAQAASASGIDVVLAGAVRQLRSQWLHTLREGALMAKRLSTVLQRGWRWRKLRAGLDSGQLRIAVWVRAKGQVREVEPMVRHWLEEGRVLPFFMQDDSFKKQDCFDYLTKKNDLPSVSLYAWLTPAILLKSLWLYLGFRFMGVRRLEFQPATAAGSKAVDPVILAPAFRRELVKSLAESVFASSVVVREMAACHAECPFGVMLVMSNYDLWGNLSAYVGKARGFRTVSIQNFNSDPWAYPTPCTLYDAHVCFDDLETAKLVQVGAAPERMLALGSVTHSTLRNAAAQRPRRQAARARLRLDDDALAILVGTQSASADASSQNSHLLEILFEAVVADRGASGLVKLHPYERMADYTKWIERAAAEKLPIHFLENWNIEDAVNAADAYISRFSTTMLLGIMLRKPTLSYVHPFEAVRARDSVDFIRTGIITSITDHDQARQWVTGLHSETVYAGYVARQEQLLAEHFSTYDEFGEQRIRKLVESMLFLEASVRDQSVAPAFEWLCEGEV